MNRHLVLKSVAILLLLLAVTMGAALGLGSVLPHVEGRNEAIELRGWIIAISITLFSSTVLFVAARRGKKRAAGDSMLRKEAIAVVGIAWLACTLHAALPYIFCEPSLAPDKAFFESVSGLTTTGATMFADIEALPRTLLLWRSATQWLGGIGILAMFTLVLSSIGATGKTMFGAESSLHSSDLSVANMRQTMRSLWLVYGSLTAVCALGLWSLGLNPFQALNHALTTTATGGFSTENDSADSFSVPVKLWIILFMLICGVSFPLYITMIRTRSLDPLKRHEETWVYLAIVVASSLFVVVEHAIQGFSASDVDIVFNLVSIITTTGYASGDYDQWPLLGKEVILLMMVIGGCSGSTSGGLKVSRFILWLKFARIELTRAFRPRVVMRQTLNGKPIPDGALGQLFVVISMATFCFVAGSLLMHVFEPNSSSVGCLAAVISSIGNIGPAFGEYGPTKNFSSLSTPSTLMLPCLMILGRLEFVAVLVLFSRKLWRKY
jgi:trk system potassium uptake protein TrkH